MPWDRSGQWACGAKGMKMASVQQPLSMEASPSPLSSRPEWSMGLRPTQGDEKRLLSGTLSMKASPFPLSSRAQPRDLQFREPFLEMFFDRAYPDFPTSRHQPQPRVRLYGKPYEFADSPSPTGNPGERSGGTCGFNLLLSHKGDSGALSATVPSRRTGSAAGAGSLSAQPSPA